MPICDTPHLAQHGLMLREFVLAHRAQHVLRRRRQAAGVALRNRPEKGRSPRVGLPARPLVLGRLQILRVGTHLGRHRSRVILGQVLDGGDHGRTLAGVALGRAGGRGVAKGKGKLSLALLLVAPAQPRGRDLVVTRHRLERIVGDLRNIQPRRHADQAVAALDVHVEKTQRLARLHRLHPQRHLAQLHRHVVGIHAVETVARHIAHRRAQIGRGRLLVARANACQVLRQPPPRADQHVAGAHRAVADFDGENGLFFKGVGSRE